MKTLVFTLTLLTGLLWSGCDNRNDPISPRNNEYDSGGENFLYNSIPECTAEADTVWHDFNFQRRTGSLKIRYSVNDLNFPSDTIALQAIATSSISPLFTLTEATDSFLILDNIMPATHQLCSLKISDAYDSTTLIMIPVTSPVLLPPPEPLPHLEIHGDTAWITWHPVISASSYNIYSTDSVEKPFERIDEIQQSNGDELSYACELPKYGSSLFIVSSVNPGGENRCNDTLFARRTDSSIPVPSLSTVSKGEYSDYIEVRWKQFADDPCAYDLYRSDNLDGPYTLIAQLPTEKANYLYTYQDSVTASNLFYYKLAAVSPKGAAGDLSEADVGFIRPSDVTFDLVVKGSVDCIELNWTPVDNAAKYKITRSVKSCQNQLTDIAVTTGYNYFDTVTTSDTYFYKVSALSSSEKLLGQSVCMPGSLGRLPVPGGFTINNTSTYSNLSWNALPGACSYIIYRSLSTCPGEKDEFITTTDTYYRDTKDIDSVRYYKIAAVDDADRTGDLSSCYKASPSLLSSPENMMVSYGVYPDAITLSWDPLKGAKFYTVYRSLTSCADAQSQKIATTTSPDYVDSVQITSQFYYSVRGVDIQGKEGSQSDCKAGRVSLLPAPGNVVATYNESANTIKVSWNAVPKAIGYTVYRGISSLFSSMAPIADVGTNQFIDTIDDTRIYYYRVTAVSNAGEGYVSDFTSGRALEPPVLTATSYSTTGVTLTWKYTRSYYRAYILSSTDSVSFTFVDSVSNASRTTIEVPDFRKHYYYVTLRTTDNNTLVKSNIVAAAKKLSTPQNVTVSETDIGAYLTWDNVAAADYYIIYRDNLSQPYKEIYYTHYLDTIFDRKQHTYYITAKNSMSESGYSEAVKGGALTTPAIPSLQTNGSVQAVIITIKPSASGSTPDGFYIYRQNSIDGNPVLLGSTSNKIYHDSTPDFSTYYYMATAFNSGGTSGFSNLVSGARRMPSAPSDLYASNAVSSRYIELTWNELEGVDSYNVYRRDNETNDFIKIGSTAATIYRDSTMGKQYGIIYYYVTSVVDTFESAQSRGVSGRIFGPPIYISASSRDMGVRISWSTVANASLYYLYRSGTENGEYTLIDSTASTYYIDTNELSTNNFYKASVYSEEIGETTELSIASNGALRRFPIAPRSIFATSATDSFVVVVTWTEVTTASSYKVYRSTSEAFTDIVEIGTVDTTVYYDSVPSDTFYFYKVKSVNRGGESSLSTTSSRGFRIPGNVPVAPTEFDTLSYSGAVRLTWSMPSPTIAYTGFKIYRSDTEDGDYTLIKTYTISTQSLHTDKPPNSFPTVYWYKIAAYNTKGSSDMTGPIAGIRR